MRTYYDSLLAGFVLGLSLGGLIAADSVLFALLMALGLWGGLLWARSAWLDARAALECDNTAALVAAVESGLHYIKWAEEHGHMGAPSSRTLIEAALARVRGGER